MTDNRDTGKTKYLVWVHGYNVDESEASDLFSEMYRRLFWLGFRGNLIGVTWRSDFGFLRFDTSVEAAFQTSPSLMFLLRNVRQWANTNAENVDLLAHSLGNLVSFDALRLQRRLGGADDMIRNMISFESATWPEAYRVEEPIEYRKPSDPVIYSVDHLKQHSWAFWFNQENYSTRDVLAGNIYHSYVPGDSVLAWMRRNDWLQRRPLHYFRDRLLRTPPVYRGPVGQNNLPNEIPTLMLENYRDRHYMWGSLNLPVGTMENPMARPNSFLATSAGWRGDKHSDYFYLWYPQIYEWYRRFLASGARI